MQQQNEDPIKQLLQLLRMATWKDILEGVVVGIGNACFAALGMIYVIMQISVGQPIAVLPVTVLLLVQVIWSVFLMSIHMVETRVKQETPAAAGGA